MEQRQKEITVSAAIRKNPLASYLTAYRMSSNFGICMSNPLDGPLPGHIWCMVQAVDIARHHCSISSWSQSRSIINIGLPDALVHCLLRIQPDCLPGCCQAGRPVSWPCW